MARKATWSLQHNSHDEVKEIIKTNDTILIPMGSTEKHGAHCPLGTDTMTAIGVVEKAAPRCNTLYTPIIPVGYSPHHMGEVLEGTGTMTLSGDTYRSVVYDVARSMIFHGFNKLIFVTHHGSNSKVIDDVLRKIRYQTGAFVGWYKTPTERTLSLLKDVIEGPPEETPGWHAGEIETSTILAYDESAVDLDKRRDDRTHAPHWMGESFKKHDGSGFVTFQGAESMWVPMEHHEYSDHATIGNAFRGTKEKGQKYFDIAADALAALVEEVKKFDIHVPEDKRDWGDRA